MNELGSKLEHHDVIIVGGGLAGLSCGAMLGKSGRQVTLLEATDRVGGRVRTDVVDGFTLDHGFQVLLTAYPACKELLDYDALRLRRFDRGALIRQKGRFRMLGDPFRHPSQAFATALNPGKPSQHCRDYTDRVGGSPLHMPNAQRNEQGRGR